MSSTISNTLEEEWELGRRKKKKKKVVKFVQIFIAVLQTYIIHLKIK